MDRKKKRPQETYDERNESTVFTFKVVKTTEPDIYAALINRKDRSRYIKNLIRADLEKNN